MISGLTHASLLVKDSDQALEWYTKKLGLKLRDNFEVNHPPLFRCSTRTVIRCKVPKASTHLLHYASRTISEESRLPRGE